jgi:hypothetical protein
MTICPKCAFATEDVSASCPRCGLIFAKYHPNTPVPEPPEDADAAAPRTTLARLILPSEPQSPATLAWRAPLLLVLAVWGARLILAGPAGNAAGESWLHLVNLPFHEAGHVFLRPFGHFLMTLGGTLGQLAVPTVCLLTLLFKTRDPFGAAVGLWWLGENFLDIAPYVNDARAGALPLLGGNTGRDAPFGFHDWEYLLTRTHLLPYDHLLAWLCHLAGALLIAAAVTWGAAILLRWRPSRQPARHRV